MSLTPLYEKDTRKEQVRYLGSKLENVLDSFTDEELILCVKHNLANTLDILETDIRYEKEYISQLTPGYKYLASDHRKSIKRIQNKVKQTRKALNYSYKLLEMIKKLKDD